jgi:ATP-dependent DNA helicase PIF1
MEDLHNPDIATDDYYANRTILTPTNAASQRVNMAVAARLCRNIQAYLSVNSVADNDGAGATGFFETEFIHPVNINGIPLHNLTPKIGVPVMILRNLNPDGGLCNGTRLRIVDLNPHVIRDTTMTGTHNGKEVLTLRNIFISDNTTQDLTFHLRLKQFPIAPTFAMTINKAQGQTVHNLVLYITCPRSALRRSLTRHIAQQDLRLDRKPCKRWRERRIHCEYCLQGGSGLTPPTG